MTIDFVAALGRDAVTTTLLLSAPMLAAGLALGVVIGILQALTSVQEQTLSFIPKVIGVTLVFLVTLPWMLRILMSYTANLFIQMARLAGS
jgi:flagellar biosynthetic protein FliQ